MSIPGNQDAAVANRFLLAYIKDQELGRRRTLAEYQELFPGCEIEIERELRLADVASAENAERRLGPYRLLRKIGRGGQGTVYLAQDTRLPRQVALKILNASSELSKAARLRFLREAELASKLEDPAICTVYEAGDEDGQLYIAMRYVEGESLSSWIASRTETDLDRAVTIVAEIARAVHEAHQIGIIHRDIKPGNIVLTEKGQPVLLDFGTAREIDSRTLTISGEVFGTPAYMAPEQVEGRSQLLDPRLDVYALGVTLYECSTLRLPFDSDSREALFRKILNRDPPDPRGVVPGFPSDLTGILEKCLEKAPERRYSTALELSEDLERFRSGEPVRARPLRAFSRLVRKARRHPVQSGLISALGLLVAVAASLFLSRDTLVEAHERERTNVVRLSAFQRLADLIREADELWPAEPLLLKRYDDWLRRATELIDSLEPSGDDVGYRAQLALLRELALPRSPAQIEAGRRSHPSFEQYQQLQAKLNALRHAEEVRGGRREPEQVAIDIESLPTTDHGLDILIHDTAGPLRFQFGSEARGLAIARHAVQRAASPAARALALSNLAWALFANGLNEEALQRGQEALSVAPNKADVLQKNRDLSSAIEAVRLGEVLTAVPSSTGNITDLAQQVEDLETKINEHQRWIFESEEDQWWQDQLSKLIAGIDRFADPLSGPVSGLSSLHGWGVARRRSHALMLIDSEDHESNVARLWQEAIASIGNRKECPAYRGLVIEPQVGLIPLGRNETSDLWEFAGVATGEPALREEDGELFMYEESGLVFVLLPGGSSRMGAQSRAPSQAHYDPQALDDEGPVHEVTLTPFFLSKYEMTQGQWLHFTGTNPSAWGPHRWLLANPPSFLQPVESVSWSDCEVVLERLGFRFPTEAEWEYGARAGTSTPWFMGDDPRLLADHGNLADAYARGIRVAQNWAFEAWFDGFAYQAPVGLFEPNRLGLHDVVGNLGEWCLDGYISEYIRVPLEQSLEDPHASPARSNQRIVRGGGYNATASLARSSYRGVFNFDLRSESIGLRPARSIRGSVSRVKPSEQR